MTRTLVEANLVDDEYFSERARGRGKLVHLFAEMIMTNTLNRPVDSSIVGFLIALRKFLEKYAPTVNGAEVMLAHLFRLLAGTVDLDVLLLGGPAVVEIKTGTPADWHGLQLAPYAFLLDGTKWLQRARFGLYLNERGGFRLKEYDEYSDLDTFFRAHEMLHWRVKHGSFERPYGRKPVDAIGISYVNDAAAIERYAIAGGSIAHDEPRDGRIGDDGDPTEEHSPF